MSKKTKSTKIFNFVSVIIAFILSFIGIVFLAVSLWYEDAQQNLLAMKYLLVSYLIFTVIIAIAQGRSEDYKFHLNQVSANSFLNHCFVYPAFFTVLVLKLISIKCNDMDFLVNEFAKWLILLAHVVMIITWHVINLKSDLKNSELMEIESFSQASIIVLTIIWILYDIEVIKWGFAILMSIFLLIQLFTKNKLIKAEKQKELSSK